MRIPTSQLDRCGSRCGFNLHLWLVPCASFLVQLAATAAANYSCKLITVYTRGYLHITVMFHREVFYVPAGAATYPERKPLIGCSLRPWFVPLPKTPCCSACPEASEHGKKTSRRAVPNGLWPSSRTSVSGLFFLRSLSATSAAMGKPFSGVL